MKKKLALITSAIAITCFAAIIFAEDAQKPQRNRERPPRTDIKPQQFTPGKTDPRARGFEAMIQQQTKRIQAEIDRENKLHQAQTGQLQAILKQAKKEKAKKTAAMLSDLIEKKNAAHQEKIKGIQKRVEEFKKRIQRNPRQQGQPGQRGQRPQRNPLRGENPTRGTRTTTPPSDK